MATTLFTTVSLEGTTIGYQPISNIMESHLMTTTPFDHLDNRGIDSNNNNNDMGTNITDNEDGINFTDPYTDTTNPRLVNGVVVLILMVLNLLGNSVVFYVYYFRIKKSVFAFFVTILAVLDLITALTTMLMDVILKMRPLDETVLDLNVLCKLTHFQVYTTSLISGCVLTLIAYQRYRKICHPLKPALKMRTARFSLLLMVLICVLLGIFTLIINGPTNIQVQMQNHVIEVTICRYDKEFEGSVLQQTFSYILLCAFALVLLLTIGFYAMVAKALKKFERRSSTGSTMPSPTSPDINVLNQEQGFTEASAERRRKRYQQQPRDTRMSVMSMGGGNDRISTQMYRVFTIVTAVFVISYLPHLVVLILNKSLKLDHKVLTYGQRIGLELAYNCPYISTVANPIVYGFRSAEFREHCKELLTCEKWRRRRAYRR